MADFTEIIQEINTNLPDNNTQSITAAKLRTTLIDLTNEIDNQQDAFEGDIQDEFSTLQGQVETALDNLIVDNLNSTSTSSALSANQGRVLNERIESIEYNLNDCISELTVQTGKFIYSTGITNTSLTNNVGSIDISNYSVIKLNYSIISGGSAGAIKWGWMIQDANGNVVAHSQDYGNNVNVPATNETILVQSGYKTLYISWNSSLSDTQYLLCGKSIGDLYNAIDTITDIQGDITDIQNLVIDNYTITNWEEKKFIRNDSGNVGGMAATSNAYQKVGSLDISNFSFVKFNYSIRGVGGIGGVTTNIKLGWCVKNEAGEVVATSSPYNAGTVVGPTDVELNVLAGYKTLYISYNFENETLQYVNGSISNKKISNSVDNLQNEVDSLFADRVFNIENEGVQSYMAVEYDNNDYSYTDINYATKNGTSSNSNYYYPIGVEIETPVITDATSRTLEFADNRVIVDGAMKNGKTITLDTTSPTYTLYNLLPNKTYYYRIYKNNDTTLVIKSGSFKTSGQLRDLRIEATQNYEYSYIANVRDVGGWKTDSGKSIRYGVLFRGNQLNAYVNETLTSYISANGINELKNIIGVNAELDFRSGDYTESALGSDVAYSNQPIDLAFYRINIYITAANEMTNIVLALRQLIQWLKNGKKIYAHCAGGCDRTGVFYACVEGICGVSENDINKDYELSNRDRSREYYLIANGANYDGDFKFAMEYIKGLIEYNNHIYVYYRNNYYDAEAVVSNYTPVPLTDATLVAALENCEFGSLKQRFHRLMKLGGMTEQEMQELEYLVCV